MGSLMDERAGGRAACRSSGIQRPLHAHQASSTRSSPQSDVAFMADGGFLRESSPPTGGALPLSGQGGREPPTLTAPPPRPPPADSVAASGCSRCTSLSFNQEWLAAFHVALCNTCRQNEKLVSKVSGWEGIANVYCGPFLRTIRQHNCFRLLQSTARIRYTLTDSDLKQLGSLRKANPHRKDWQPMHLYMQSQVGEER